MSYRIYKVGSDEPDTNNEITIAGGNSIAFSWIPATTSPINFGASSSGWSSGHNMTFYKHSASYVSVIYGASVTVSNSSYNPIPAQYQAQYFDVINLPQGDFEVIFRYAGSSNSQTLDGTLAMVNNASSNVLSTKIKTSDKYRNNTLKQLITAPAGGLNLSFRFLAGAANYANSEGFVAQSLIIYKRG